MNPYIGHRYNSFKVILHGEKLVIIYSVHKLIKTSYKVEQLRLSVDSLNREICVYQAKLPTAGSARAVANPGPSSHILELFDKHVAGCTMQNWKYWVFSRLMQPLLQVSFGQFSQITPNLTITNNKIH